MNREDDLGELGMSTFESDAEDAPPVADNEDDDDDSRPRTSTSQQEPRDRPVSHERIDGYLPIGSYGLIGDCRSAALVGVDGSIDWLCLPRFDDDALFGRILDAGKGGSWQLHPDEPHDVHQRYRDRTNLLDTVFATGTGVVVVTDFMPLDERSVVQHAKPHNHPRVDPPGRVPRR